MLNGNYKLKFLALLALFALVVFPTLGRVTLWDSDEGRYLVCAKNAIEHGRWIIPEYNGGDRIQKPPLMVWLVAVSSLAFNNGKVNEFFARLPSVAAAFGVLVVLFLFVSWYAKDERLALYSCFFLSTSLLFIKQARFAITDMVLLFFIVSAICSGVYALEKRSSLAFYAAFALCGIGFMDKGPVAFVVPSLVVFLWSISERRPIPWKKVPFGLLVFLVLALWWPLVVGRRYWEAFIVKSNIDRMLHNPAWKTSLFFYVLNFPAHFITASCLIPTAFWALKRYRRPALSLFFIWFWVVFVLFSISDTKRSSYILPLYPAASVIVAWAFLRAKRLVWAKTLALFVLLGGLARCLYIFFKYNAPYLWCVLALLAMAFAVLLYFVISREKAFVVVACALFALSYTNLYQPAADVLFHSPKRCVEEMKAYVDGEPLYIYGSLRANELWYWGREKIEKVEKLGGLKGFVYTRKRKDLGLPLITCCSYQKHRLCLYRLKGGE